jgi:hypothetical protein
VAQEQDRLSSTTIFTKLDTPYGRESLSDTCAGSHGIRLEQQTQTKGLKIEPKSSQKKALEKPSVGDRTKAREAKDRCPNPSQNWQQENERTDMRAANGLLVAGLAKPKINPRARKEIRNETERLLLRRVRATKHEKDALVVWAKTSTETG